MQEEDKGSKNMVLTLELLPCSIHQNGIEDAEASENVVQSECSHPGHLIQRKPSVVSQPTKI